MCSQGFNHQILPTFSLACQTVIRSISVSPSPYLNLLCLCLPCFILIHQLELDALSRLRFPFPFSVSLFSGSIAKLATTYSLRVILKTRLDIVCNLHALSAALILANSLSFPSKFSSSSSLSSLNLNSSLAALFSMNSASVVVNCLF